MNRMERACLLFQARRAMLPGACERWVASTSTQQLVSNLSWELVSCLFKSASGGLRALLVHDIRHPWLLERRVARPTRASFCRLKKLFCRWRLDHGT
jgi:hypothetical protein